jgi:hypothetical protein
MPSSEGGQGLTELPEEFKLMTLPLHPLFYTIRPDPTEFKPSLTMGSSSREVSPSHWVGVCSERDVWRMQGNKPLIHR